MDSDMQKTPRTDAWFVELDRDDVPAFTVACAMRERCKVLERELNTCLARQAEIENAAGVICKQVDALTAERDEARRCLREAMATVRGSLDMLAEQFGAIPGVKERCADVFRTDSWARWTKALGDTKDSP